MKYSEIDYIAHNKGNINTFLQATFTNLNTVTLKKAIKNDSQNILTENFKPCSGT